MPKRRSLLLTLHCVEKKKFALSSMIDGTDLTSRNVAMSTTRAMTSAAEPEVSQAKIRSPRREFAGPVEMPGESSGVPTVVRSGPSPLGGVAAGSGAVLVSELAAAPTSNRRRRSSSGLSSIGVPFCGSTPVVRSVMARSSGRTCVLRPIRRASHDARRIARERGARSADRVDRRLYLCQQRRGERRVALLREQGLAVT